MYSRIIVTAESLDAGKSTRAKQQGSDSRMKRTHDDISPPTNGNGPTEASAEVAAGNGEVKSKEPTSPAGQSSAAKAVAAAAATSAQQRKKCPYLDTINRNVLDFDFEKVCTTLQAVRVYLCASVLGPYL